MMLWSWHNSPKRKNIQWDCLMTVCPCWCMSPDSSIEKQKGVWEESTIKTLHGGQELVEVACSLQQSFQVLFGFSPLCIFMCLFTLYTWREAQLHRLHFWDSTVSTDSTRPWGQKLDGRRRAVCNSRSKFHPPLNFVQLTPLLMKAPTQSRILSPIQSALSPICCGQNLKEYVNIHQLHVPEFWHLRHCISRVPLIFTHSNALLKVFAHSNAHLKVFYSWQQTLLGHFNGVRFDQRRTLLKIDFDINCQLVVANL